MSLAAKLLSASGGVDKLYVDDVFSAYTYTGNGSTQTINNGIDLAGKGGMVWTKQRNASNNHALFDTVRGVTKQLASDAISAQNTYADTLTAFNSIGYALGSDAATWLVNKSAATYVSWTFRKAPKFFDVVTYTGNGASSRAITHLLGQEVGMVMTKATSTAGDWNTYHRSATGDLVLNSTAAQTGSKALVNSATTTTFTVSEAANTNAVTYVAYLFAHDTSADGFIQCGSFTTDGSGNATVTLGWEPQYVLYKATALNDPWRVADSARGLTSDSTSTLFLYPNQTNADTDAGIYAPRPNATGFTIVQGASRNFIYLAIRRPNKPPTLGTQVYNAIARTGTGGAAMVTGVGFAPDLLVSKTRNQAGSFGKKAFYDRLRGAKKLIMSTDTSSEGNDDATGTGGVCEFTNTGVLVGSDSFYGLVNYSSGHNYINHFFKRAPGVFDVVCDTGTGSAHAIAHSLTVVPELMIRKKRSAGDNWIVYAGDATNYLILNGTAATADLDTMWNDTAPTASAFTVGTNDDVNQSAGTFVTYLFATLPGISKVGSYTGNGSSQTIDCGFTTGARFILIKRTDAAGDWYVWDTVRGLVAGNDPHLSLNSTTAEITTDDSLDPASVGFIVNQLAATNINVTSASYIYLSFA